MATAGSCATLRRAESEEHLGHQFRAVSVRHLVSVIRQDMSALGFGDTATVHDIAANIIRAKGNDVICPRDGDLGAAYVDCISGDEHVGLATHMLSYSWSYCVKDIADTLLKFCGDERWGCAFR